MADAVSLFTIGSSLFSALSAFGAAGDAKDAGKKNAAFERAEAAEQARRAENENKRTRAGAAAAQAAGGGTLDSGSFLDYLGDLTQQQDAEVSWLKQAGESRADIAKANAKATSRQATAEGIGALASGAGGIYSFGQGKAWWA